MTKSILQHENLCSSSWSVFQSDRVFCSNNNNPVATNKLLCLRRRWSVFISTRDFTLAPISNHPKIHRLWETVGRSSSSKSPFYIMFSFWCYDFLAPFLYCYFHTSYSHREWKKRGSSLLLLFHHANWYFFSFWSILLIFIAQLVIASRDLTLL